MQSQAISVNINIKLFKQFSQFAPDAGKDGYELHKKIRSYIQSINTNNYFFENFTLDISLLPGKPAGTGNGFMLYIDDLLCRVPMPDERKTLTADEFYHVISYSLLQNLLIIRNGDTLLSTEKVQSNGKPNGKIRLPEFPEFIVLVNEYTLAQILKDESDHFQSEKWTTLASNYQDSLFYELGIPIPYPDVQINNKLLDFTFQVVINSFPLPVDNLIGDKQVFLGVPPKHAALYGHHGIPHVDPVNYSVHSLITYLPAEKEKLRIDLDHAKIPYWDFRGYLILKLTYITRKHAASLLNESLIDFMTNKLRKYYPDLVKIFEEKFSKHTLLSVLRLLLDEEISIADLSGIMDCMLGILTSTDKDDNKNIMFLPKTNYIASLTKNKTMKDVTASDYLSVVRSFLNNLIINKYTLSQSSLTVYLLSPEMEAIFFAAVSDNIALKGEYKNKMLHAIHLEVRAVPNPVILTTQHIRAMLHEMVKIEMPRLHVIAYSELTPQIHIQPIGRITI